MQICTVLYFSEDFYINTSVFYLTSFALKVLVFHVKVFCFVALIKISTYYMAHAEVIVPTVDMSLH